MEGCCKGRGAQVEARGQDFQRRAQIIPQETEDSQSKITIQPQKILY